MSMTLSKLWLSLRPCAHAWMANEDDRASHEWATYCVLRCAVDMVEMQHGNNHIIRKPDWDICLASSFTCAALCCHLFMPHPSVQAAPRLGGGRCGHAAWVHPPHPAAGRPGSSTQASSSSWHICSCRCSGRVSSISSSRCNSRACRRSGSHTQ